MRPELRSCGAISVGRHSHPPEWCLLNGAYAGFCFNVLPRDPTGLSVMHNHPSGDPTPSRADIDMTKTIIDTAKPLGITVHDHIIIGKDGHVSLKGLRLI